MKVTIRRYLQMIEAGTTMPVRKRQSVVFDILVVHNHIPPMPSPATIRMPQSW